MSRMEVRYDYRYQADGAPSVRYGPVHYARVRGEPLEDHGAGARTYDSSPVQSPA